MSDARSETAERLIDAFLARGATVAVVGMGYVGLPMTRAFHDAGFRVLGFDIDAAKIDKLARGEAYLKHLGEGLFRELASSARFDATSDATRLGEAEAIVLCVPTPLDDNREPDLRYVRDSTQLAARALRAGQVVVLTSTSYPGTTREICLAMLERVAGERGLSMGEDVFLAFSPEREDPGRATHTTRTIPRLVGGTDPVSTAVAVALFEPAVEDVIPVASAEVAEAAKLVENVYRAVNIALVNELKPVLAALGLDVWDVLDAAETKPFGFQRFDPGPGLGGHCIPIDPFYLAWRARQAGVASRFIELAGEINSSMPGRVVEATERALREQQSGSEPGREALVGAHVLVVGLAYKRDVDDVRETPAAEIIRLLKARGAEVEYHDPHVAEFPAMRKYRFDLRSVDLTPERLASADAVMIVTDHSDVDYALIGEHARLVIDTRNAMARVARPVARVVKA